MLFGTDDFILVPSVKVLVADFQLDELLVEFLEGRLIVLYAQCLIVHGRGIEARLPGVDDHD